MAESEKKQTNKPKTKYIKNIVINSCVLAKLNALLSGGHGGEENTGLRNLQISTV